jgi:hypothetical protein
LHAALERFFDELRADPLADATLVQEYEDAMAGLYLDADENASSQELYDLAVSIAEDSDLTHSERCVVMHGLMKSVLSHMRPPDG